MSEKVSDMFLRGAADKIALALDELDSVTADDLQAGAIGCAENALRQALAWLTAPQPPAEAMEAWHSAMNDVGELRANAPDERYASRAARVESWIKANRPEPPSAPVGVEAAEHANVLRDLLADEYSEREDDGSPSFTLERAALQAAIDALAQQPAAVDEGLSHADLCRLSRVFNAHNVPGLAQDQRINDWLGERIATALAAQQERPYLATREARG